MKKQNTFAVSWNFLLTALALNTAGVSGQHALAQPNTWTNPQVGTTAGDWFDASNWSNPFVPIPSDVAQIGNGGEAVANSTTAMGGTISVNRLEVGKNGGIGTLTDTGVAVSTRVDLDLGEIGGGIASGPVIIHSNGSATITDAASIVVGTGGSGDIDIGPSSATQGAEADAIGSLTIERVPLVTVADNVEIGRAGGAATATGNGTLHLNDVATFDVGGALFVGDTIPAAGVNSAMGTLVLDMVGNLTVGSSTGITAPNKNFLVGSTVNTGGQDTSRGSATLTDSDGIAIGNNLDVAMASVTAAGVVDATGSLNIQTADSLTVDNLLGIGHIRGTSGHGQATVMADGTVRDVATVTINRDLFVGRSATKDDVVGTAHGTFTLERSATVTIGADLDVGQTITSGSPLAGSASSQGTGNATLRDITGTLSVADGIDIGTTSSAANSTAEGNGTLLLERIGALEVGIDLKVGRVTGAGQSIGTGLLTVSQTPSIIIGDDFEVGRTTGSSSGVNTGRGTATVSDATISVGFGNPLLGALNVGDALVTLNQQASASGDATFERVTLNVADRISVGTLAGGSTNSLTQASGALRLVASSVTTPQLDVAAVLDGTAGMAQGSLHLNPSLVTVAGAMNLAAGATLEIDLAGTTRADGTGVAGQYSAIDAGNVTLAGTLDVHLLDAFVPAVGDAFQIISGPLNGSQFDTVNFPALAGLHWDISYQPTVVLLEVLAGGFTADFNNDNQVDRADLDVWQASFGASAGADADADGDSDGADFLAWQQQLGSGIPPLLPATQAVPEPATWGLLLFAAALVMAGPKRCRMSKRWQVPFWKNRQDDSWVPRGESSATRPPRQET